MSVESEFLRDEIRTGRIACVCGLDAGHYEGCKWATAVCRIYEIERTEELKERKS